MLAYLRIKLLFQFAILLYLLELLTLLLFGAVSGGSRYVVLTDHIELADANHGGTHGCALTVDIVQMQRV